jgi:iron complex outermembrane recepter protein
VIEESNVVYSQYAYLQIVVTLFLLLGGEEVSFAGQQNDDLNKIYSMSLEELRNLKFTGAAVRNLGLIDVSQPVNRLGLNVIEMPITIDVIDSYTMRARGLKNVTEAVESLGGIIFGESPADPSSFSMRGFSLNEVTILRDGIRSGSAAMTMRPQNTFNLERIEVLKGPVAAPYTRGGAAGTINMVTKKPDLEKEKSSEILLSYGRYDSYDIGIGMGGPLAHNTAYRVDIHSTGSNGWVDRTRSKSTNITASLLLNPKEDITVTVSADYLQDDLPAYWGTPLVSDSFAKSTITDVIETNDNRTLDERMRFVNYNVDDQHSESEHLWLRLAAAWTISEQLSIDNNVFYFTADRTWINAESYVFNATTERIDRDRFFVLHDHEYWGNQLDITLRAPIGKLENTLVIGIDYSSNDVLRSRGFPDGDDVDPFNVIPGKFGPLNKRKSPTDIELIALVLEDSLSLTHNLTAIGSARYERTDLERQSFDVAGNNIVSDSFERVYKPFSYSLGFVHQATDTSSIYIQTSKGHNPPGSDIFLTDASENFEFTDIRQHEIGVKLLLDNQSVELTAAYYNIHRDNIVTLTQGGNLDNSGNQKSSGMELSVSAKLTKNERIGGNIAYTDASYGQYIDPNFSVDASGNRPPNVPRWVANLWISSSHIGGGPFEVGAGVRFVDDRYANTNNSVVLKNYTLVNFFAAYSMHQFRLMAHMRNVFDTDFSPWADIFYPNQVTLGVPRTFEISAHFQF